MAHPLTFVFGGNNPKMPRFMARDDASEAVWGAGTASLSGPELVGEMLSSVRRAEDLGVDYVLVGQRWWGSGEEVESSTFDSFAVTALYASNTSRIGVITAVHPGFVLPGPVAKWGATVDRISNGRWAINITSGWHLAEFHMYGVDPLDHDERYARASEFIDILRLSWSGDEVTYDGRYYSVQALRLAPAPTRAELQIFQGGQSPAALQMGATRSDWLFINGGTLERTAERCRTVRDLAADQGRRVRIAMHCQVLCRESDAEADEEIERMLEQVEPALLERRAKALTGATGMWSDDDRLSALDTNEGYACRFIGSPATVLERIAEFHRAGVECFHASLNDALFVERVLPAMSRIGGAVAHDS
jgi:dimethylsulfone monooxygenase